MLRRLLAWFDSKLPGPIESVPVDPARHSVAWSTRVKEFCAVVSVGGESCIKTSPDGINWTLRTVPGDGICWASVSVVTSSKPELEWFYVTNDEHSHAVVSLDGINWALSNRTSSCG